MKMDKLRERMRKDRPMTAITLRMPEDVVADLKTVADRLGFSGYQPLIRAYVGQGLRTDLERLEKEQALDSLVEILKRQGVSQEILARAIAEVKGEAA
jgi:hypothetical protein